MNILKKELIEKVNNIVDPKELIILGFEIEKIIEEVLTNRLTELNSNFDCVEKISEVGLEDCNNIFL